MKAVNLLPENEKDAVQKEVLFSKFKIFAGWTFLSYVLVFGVLLAAKFYFDYTLSNLDSQIQRQKAVLSKTDNVALKNKIDYYNNIVNDYSNLQKSNPRWSNVLIAFAKLVPQQILIENFTANAKTGRIDISGVGLNRDAVLQLRANIAQSKLFKNINLPLENLQTPVDTEFHYTFFLTANALNAQ